MKTERPNNRDSSWSATLGIMTKYWESKRVKTRLAVSIGDQAACQIHREFTLHLCETLAKTCAQRFLFLDPIGKQDDIKSDLALRGISDKWNFQSQEDGDLGNRMLRWFNTQLQGHSHSSKSSILIGSDCPLIDSSQIELARQSLTNVDMVLGPASDGGYYLIGMRDTVTSDARIALFQNMPWSTHTVLAETRKRLEHNHISWVELEPADDIDTVFDLRRLIQLLSKPASSNVYPPYFARNQNLAERIHSIVADCPPEAKAILHETLQ